MLKYLLICSYFIIVFSSIADENVETLQEAFTSLFCGGCKDCMQNENNITVESGWNVSQRLIQFNVLGIENIETHNFTIEEEYTFPRREGTSTKEMVIKKKMNGTISFPKISLTFKKPKGVIAYFHPTVIDRRRVPSSWGLEYLAIIGLYAASGYIVIMPDYIGLTEPYAHPYVIYPQQNVRSMISALNNQSSVIEKYYGLSLSEKLPLFTVGYSEGAGYSVWFEKCVKYNSQCPYNQLSLSSFYLLSGSIGMDGAYDLNNTVISFLTERVGIEYQNNKYRIEEQWLTNMVKPMLSALTLFAFSQYSRMTQAFFSMFVQDFYYMKCTNSTPEIVCKPNGLHQVNMTEALLGKYKQEELMNAIAASAAGKENHEYWPIPNYVVYEKIMNKDHYNNSGKAFINPWILSNQYFNESLTDATLTGYQSTNLFIFSLQNDSVVSPLNSEELRNKSNNTIQNYYNLNNTKYRICTIKHQGAPVDHLHGEIPGNIFSLVYIQNRTIEIQNNPKLLIREKEKEKEINFSKETE